MASVRLLLIALVVVALGGEAWAKKRIVVLKFAGRAAQPQREVEELVRKDNTVVSDAAMRRAQRRLKVKRLNDSGYARLAAELQADAFITGDLQRKRGGRYNLELTLRDGKTGAVSETLDVPMTGARVDSAARADLAMKLEPALAKVGALSDEPLEITRPGVVATNPADDSDNEAAPLTGVKPLPPPRNDAATTGGATALVVRDEMVAQRRARHAAAEVSVGATVVRRKLSFTSTDELTPSQRPNGYNGSVVPSVTVTGEVYPLAFSSRPAGAIGGLGVGFVFDRVLGLKSKLGATEYTTTQQKIGGNLRYRWNLGHKATDPTVKFIAGFNALTFEIDRGADDIDLPNFSYTYLDVGAAGRFPLGTPMFALYVDLRYDQIFGSGEVSEKAFYGEGGAMGFEGDGGLEVRLLQDRLVVKLGARYQRIAFDFDGTGDRAVNRDGNPVNQDVGGALDQYLAGYLTAGYVF